MKLRSLEIALVLATAVTACSGPLAFDPVEHLRKVAAAEIAFATANDGRYALLR